MREVQRLLAPPPALMKPPVLVRVLRHAKRGPTGTPVSLAAGEVSDLAAASGT